MKIFALMIMAWREGGYMDKPIIFSSGFDLSSFGYFQRSSVQEFIVFFSRTLMERTARGSRQSIDNEEYVCHIHLQGNGLGAIAVCDKEYPQRVAFTALTNMLAEFHTLHGETWPYLKQDTPLDFPQMKDAIVAYQNPANADKLTKIHEDLEKTTEIVRKTIDSVLDRGKKLEDLVKQSEDLGMQSKLFYQNAKSANSCCTIM
jgi:synaptobrevin family protein YKT6